MTGQQQDNEGLEEKGGMDIVSIPPFCFFILLNYANYTDILVASERRYNDRPTTSSPFPYRNVTTTHHHHRHRQPTCRRDRTWPQQWQMWQERKRGQTVKSTRQDVKVRLPISYL